LTNLLSNALKYTSHGGVTFHARKSASGNLRFDITDTGIGIREEDAAKLFKPFEQLDTRKNRNIIGTGLGLAISYNLCKLMGGDMWLESKYGEGSTFSVELPYVLAENAEETAAAPPDEFLAPDARVMVVDDIDVNLAVVEAMLGVFGIPADLADGGAKAVQYAREKRYDVIFMDHMMPGMDGIEATRLIRANEEERVPIIALTANAIQGMQEMFLENGFDDFLSKPMDINSLNLCLRKWLPAEKILR
jgi:CheY-like chemotaxis protein